MYYNSTSGQFKAIKNGGAPIGTWASGGALNTARNQIGNAGSGVTNALALEEISWRRQKLLNLIMELLGRSRRFKCCRR